jgi:hypothetical protein
MLRLSFLAWICDINYQFLMACYGKNIYSSSHSMPLIFGGMDHHEKIYHVIEGIGVTHAD